MNSTHVQTEVVSHKTKYLIVFILVALLIVFDVFVVKSQLVYSTKAAIIIASCVAKVFIELYFYMHLKEETVWLKVIAAVPVLAIITAIVLMLEGAYR